MFINWNRLTTIEDVEVTKATDDAFYITANDIEVWVPKSIIADGSDITLNSEIGDKGELVLPEDIAVDKGLV